jgi:hypothetical protein
MSNDISDVLTRELAWLNADPPPGGSYNSAPNLNSANAGGFFDTIQADAPKITPEAPTLYLEYVKTEEDRYAMGGEKVQIHDVHICMYWPFNNSDGSYETAKANFRNAINAVFIRLRGPLGDKSHNSQFLEAGEKITGGLFREEPDLYSFVYEIDYQITDLNFVS